MLDTKQISTIFLFEFKMSCKAAETMCNINNAFGPGTANRCTVKWWFKKFGKVDEGLEDEENVGWPSTVDNNQSRAIIGAGPLKTTWEAAKEFSVGTLPSFSIWSKLERQKSLINGCLMSWPRESLWLYGSQ